jgi:hypothetical protein
LEKRTIIGIATAANTEIGTTTATAPVPVSLYVINHVVLYVTRKAVDYGTTPKKNEKSLKLSSGLLTETSLANLTTDLINDSINTLWTMRMTILTQKKNLRKLFKY